MNESDESDEIIWGQKIILYLIPYISALNSNLSTLSSQFSVLNSHLSPLSSLYKGVVSIG